MQSFLEGTSGTDIKEIKRRSVRGGVQVFAAQGVKLCLQITSLAVLSRLLKPEDFGLIAMVTAITIFIGMFKDMGLAVATVQAPTIDQYQVSTLYLINVSVSVLLTFITVAASPLVAWFYGEPRLVAVTACLALGFTVSGLSVQHFALLRRTMNFRKIAIIEVASVLAGFVVGIGSATAGLGYWSLVTSQLVTLVVSTCGAWFAFPWKPTMPGSWRTVRSLVRFGGNLTAFELVNYFNRNLDNLLIGKFWGAVELGFYARAYNILMLPLSQINAPLGAVTVPALSAVASDPARFRSYYLRALSIVTLITAPLAALLAVQSEEIIRLVLGPEWSPSVTIFRYLALSILVQPICNTSGWLYTATGRSDLLLKWGGIGSVFIVLSFFVGLPFGSSGVALCYSVVMLLWTLPCMYVATRHTAITLGDVLNTVKMPLFSSFFAAVAAFVMQQTLCAGVATPLRLGVCSAVFLTVYLLCVFRSGGKEICVCVMKELRPQE